jgi:hypothetical protein
MKTKIIFPGSREGEVSEEKESNAPRSTVIGEPSEGQLWEARIGTDFQMEASFFPLRRIRAFVMLLG